MSQIVDVSKLSYFDHTQLVQRLHERDLLIGIALRDFATAHNLSISQDEQRRFDFIASQVHLFSLDLSRGVAQKLYHSDVMVLSSEDFPSDYQVPDLEHCLEGSADAAEVLIGIGAIVRDFLRSEGFSNFAVVSYFDTVMVKTTYYLRVKFF